MVDLANDSFYIKKTDEGVIISKFVDLQDEILNN